MSRFSIEVDDKQAVALFKKLEGNIRGTTSLYKEVGEIITGSVAENFMVGGRWSGKVGSYKGGSEKWKPLAESTKARSKKGSNRKILFDEGNLANSISYEASGVGVEVGTSDIKAATHQFGRGPFSSWKTRRKFAEIPARPFLVVQAEDMEEIINAGEQHMMKGITN